jgi:hypothetical protein
MHVDRDSIATPQTRAKIYLALVADVLKSDTKRYEGTIDIVPRTVLFFFGI